MPEEQHMAELIAQAVEEAIQPLQNRIFTLEATIARQGEMLVALESTQATHSENQLIQLRLINDLRGTAKNGPQPTQRDRGEILRALLAINGGKMLAKEARRIMHLSESRFSELLARMEDDIEKRPYHLDRTQNIIILR